MAMQLVESLEVMSSEGEAASDKILDMKTCLESFSEVDDCFSSVMVYVYYFFVVFLFPCLKKKTIIYLF